MGIYEFQMKGIFAKNQLFSVKTHLIRIYEDDVGIVR